MFPVGAGTKPAVWMTAPLSPAPGDIKFLQSINSFNQLYTYPFRRKVIDGIRRE